MAHEKKQFDATIERRITLVLLFFFAAVLALIARLFLLQIIQYREYSTLAAKQHRLVEEIVSERGTIFTKEKDGTLVPLARDHVFKILTASPKLIKNAEEAASAIAQEFKLDYDGVLKKLSKKEDLYEILARKIDAEQAEKFDARRIPGIFFEDETRRIYPQETLAAHLLGFVSRETDEEVGRYGLERFYEKDLIGEKGVFEGNKDTSGFWIALGKRIIHPPRNGSHVVLTIDHAIQVKSEEVLKRAVQKWGAKSGSVLVLDPTTGALLALAALPTFDPNEFSKEKDFGVFLNPVVEATYESGSVMKPITMAGALEAGVIKPDTTYQDTGAVKISGYTIKNFDEKAYGVQTMTQVLEKSLNTGAMYAAHLLGKERQLAFLKDFGLGEKTKIDLPGEVSGDISNLSEGRDIDFATASFGQGIAVTEIQLASAIAVIANGGKLMKPYVVDEIIEDSGNKIKKEPQLVRQVIAQGTAETLTKMLISAVRNGFENRAGIKGYFVAGKTGTAQIPRRDGRSGYSDQVIHTFVGYAPAFHPRFLILLRLDEPKGNRFAANTLTPAFRDLAEFILHYYEIPPDEK